MRQRLAPMVDVDAGISTSERESIEPCRSALEAGMGIDAAAEQRSARRAAAVAVGIGEPRAPVRSQAATAARRACCTHHNSDKVRVSCMWGQLCGHTALRLRACLRVGSSAPSSQPI